MLKARSPTIPVKLSVSQFGNGRLTSRVCLRWVLGAGCQGTVLRTQRLREKSPFLGFNLKCPQVPGVGSWSVYGGAGLWGFTSSERWGLAEGSRSFRVVFEGQISPLSLSVGFVLTVMGTASATGSQLPCSSWTETSENVNWNESRLPLGCQEFVYMDEKPNEHSWLRVCVLVCFCCCNTKQILGLGSI